MTPDLLDGGVDDGAAPAGFLVADQHPVLHAELGGSDRSFDQVVVESEPSVFETRFAGGEVVHPFGHR